jgi:predicted dienelactone hydrolase
MHRLVVTKGSRNSNPREEEADVIRIAVVVAVADEAVEMVAVVVAVAIAFEEDGAVEMAIEMVAVAGVEDGAVAAAALKEAAKEPAVGMLISPRLTKHTWKSTN